MIPTVEVFWAAYTVALLDRVTTHPGEYGLREGETAEDYALKTAQRMRAAVESRHPESGPLAGMRRGFGAVNYRTPAFRKAAARAGVAFNRKGLETLYL